MCTFSDWDPDGRGPGAGLWEGARCGLRSLSSPHLQRQKLPFSRWQALGLWERLPPCGIRAAHHQTSLRAIHEVGGFIL